MAYEREKEVSRIFMGLLLVRMTNAQVLTYMQGRKRRKQIRYVHKYLEEGKGKDDKNNTMIFFKLN